MRDTDPRAVSERCGPGGNRLPTCGFPLPAADAPPRYGSATVPPGEMTRYATIDGLAAVDGQPREPRDDRRPSVRAAAEKRRGRSGQPSAALRRPVHGGPPDQAGGEHPLAR